jgi:predicted RNase H-like nuclease
MPLFGGMGEIRDGTWLAGVDGCRGGWIAAFVRVEGDEARLEVFADFSGVPASGASVLAVDMPIGLPARTGQGGRAAENCVRPLLGARQSSVFAVPSRAAIYAKDYAQACRIAVETSDPPRKVSKQLFHIAPKIREIDTCLRSNPARAGDVYEVHPEVAFWRLNGGRALGEPKKIKGKLHPAGIALRQELLLIAGLPEPMVRGVVPKGAAQDDLLDALACAAIARRISRGMAEPFPNPPPRDDHNLRMAIWA